MRLLHALPLRIGVAVMCLALPLALLGCGPTTARDDRVGVGITGIDHLAEHLSVQDFSVDGYNAAQAGKGGSTVCCAMVPAKWRPGLKVHVRWNVTNWRDRTWENFERDVEIDRYEEVGRLYVHFMTDGSVRAVLSNYYPEASLYPGPRDPIPQKEPWHKYPWDDDKPVSAATK